MLTTQVLPQLKIPNPWSSADFVLPDFIQEYKKVVVRIFRLEPKMANPYVFLGTGVVIGSRRTGKEFILTCEHVVSIKDSMTGKTTGRHKDIYASFNLYNGSTIMIALSIVHPDEINDFTLLGFSFSGLPALKDSLNRINLVRIPFEMFDNTTELREGEPLQRHLNLREMKD